MYKCKECGFEYEIKPEYCDCGNDEFEEVLPEVKVQETKPADIQKEQQVKASSAKDFHIESAKPKEPARKKAFSEQYPSLARFFASIDPISGGIFLTCIILSFLIVLFAWNPTEQVITEQKTETAITKNIPSIDSFWNNSTEGMVQEKKEAPKKEEPKIAIQIPKIVQSIVPQQKIQPKKISVVTVKPTQTKTTSKTTTTPKTSNKTNTQKTTTTVQKAQTTQTPVAKPTVQVTQPPIVVQQKDPALIAAEEAKKSIAMKQELANYKASLRNTIGRKIDFTKVIGDGTCSISFKIDSSGKLINRSFTQQSGNITMNDAVYAAMMATPSYNPPPSGYKNETLKLTVRFQNGNFEISLN